MDFDPILSQRDALRLGTNQIFTFFSGFLLHILRCQNSHFTCLLLCMSHFRKANKITTDLFLLVLVSTLLDAILKISGLR